MKKLKKDGEGEYLCVSKTISNKEAEERNKIKINKEDEERQQESICFGVCALKRNVELWGVEKLKNRSDTNNKTKEKNMKIKSHIQSCEV